MSFLFHPRKHRMGDPTIVRVGDVYHFFTEATPHDRPELGPVDVLHATSKDLIHWDEQPEPCFHVSEPGSCDGFMIYHMDVFYHDGVFNMFYTGLDKRGPGQQQTICLATSRDGVSWTKHPKNPVVRADMRYYEPAIPPEATYQKKDLGRLWFRDPCVIIDPKSGEFGMVVMARDLNYPIDTRACVSWSTSRDLVNWTTHPPIYSPNKYHTIEVANEFEHNGRHYLLIMTHPGWGVPYATTDPYQDAACIYLISENGPTGPWRTPSDEIIIGAANTMRCGVQRVLTTDDNRPAKDRDGTLYLYSSLFTSPAPDDAPAREPQNGTRVNTTKPIDFTPEGVIRVMYPSIIEKYTKSSAISAGSRPEIASSPNWRRTDAGVAGKSFDRRSIVMFDLDASNFIFSTRIRFLIGCRAGIVARAARDGSSGWQIVLDRQRRRVEFGILGDASRGPAGMMSASSSADAPDTTHLVRSEGFLDARAWKPTDEAELKIVADDISVEVYVDDRLMLQQVRHRETTGRVGFVIDRAEAEFLAPRLLELTI